MRMVTDCAFVPRALPTFEILDLTTYVHRFSIRDDFNPGLGLNSVSTLLRLYIRYPLTNGQFEATSNAAMKS
jgi:hypothetical protein